MGKGFHSVSNTMWPVPKPGNSNKIQDTVLISKSQQYSLPRLIEQQLSEDPFERECARNQVTGVIKVSMRRADSNRSTY